jgi:site-specific DNA recombinase
MCRWPIGFSFLSDGPGRGPVGKAGRQVNSTVKQQADGPMSSAAIYARVSSAKQKKDQTIGSQIAALREHAARLGVELPEAWIFTDEGHSGATLVRPALERLRDLVAGACVDVVLVYAPDRLARKFAYQALLIEEFARAGTRVEFVVGPRGDSPEDQLLVQFQGMFAEYEKAQLAERYRRGKTYRAKSGSVNVLGGAPFGYRYVRKTPECGARYEIVEHEAALVAEMFRRYTDEGASIADLTRWLTAQGVPTRTGKARWDRSVVWSMLRNPAYAGKAVFGKTMIIHEQPGLNRVARLQGRTTPRAVKAVDRPRQEWIEIGVPAIISGDTFDRAAQRLADNKRFASRNSKVPSLLQGLAACAACGYGYYRTSTRTTNKKIYYYRCLGSDDYRYEGGRVCGNKPVRADYLDQVVWNHIVRLLADPHLIRAEIDKRLAQARTSDPVVKQRTQLESALAKATTAITAMIEAFQEQLITIDELRARMPGLRARQAGLRGQLAALEAQLADREAYLKLADDLDGFLAQLHTATDTAEVSERQRILRLLVKDVLIGPEKITIRHRIPVRGHPSAPRPNAITDTEGDHRPSYPLRWGRDRRTLRAAAISGLQGAVRPLERGLQPPLHIQQDPPLAGVMGHRLENQIMIEIVEEPFDIKIDDPIRSPAALPARPHRIQRALARPITIGIGMEDLLHLRLQGHGRHRLRDPISDARHA